ncbi:hypothetical protein Leryth_022682 [Lithospermum erythrorhizon]|nr:hypothetical protein Leryth_022682 [Lithospermum erythrorhizon]
MSNQDKTSSSQQQEIDSFEVSNGTNSYVEVLVVSRGNEYVDNNGLTITLSVESAENHSNFFDRVPF